MRIVDLQLILLACWWCEFFIIIKFYFKKMVCLHGTGDPGSISENMISMVKIDPRYMWLILTHGRVEPSGGSSKHSLPTEQYPEWIVLFIQESGLLPVGHNVDNYSFSFPCSSQIPLHSMCPTTKANYYGIISVLEPMVLLLKHLHEKFNIYAL